MLGQLNMIFSKMTGFGAAPIVGVRETPAGYVIETEYLEEGGAALSCHLWSFAIVGLWAGAMSYWLIGLPWAAGADTSPLLLVLALLASGISLGWSMMRGARSYVVEIDLMRDRLRCGYARGGRAEFVPGSIPFSDIRDVVITRPLGGPGERALCIRARGRARPVELARGDEATLAALYDRVRHDLAPIEERLAALHIRGLSARVKHPVFPPLGPHEIVH